MMASPEAFMQCLPACAEKMQAWYQSGKHKVLALYLFCDLLEHLKEKSETLWEGFMPAVFACLLDKDPDARTAAAYAVNLAAPLPRFAAAAPEAYRTLAQIISAPSPKKRDSKAKMA